MGRARRRRRREPGGINALADLLDRHRGAFEYDWRARFSLPLAVVGEAMTWGEALRLTQILMSDGSSRVGAAVGGWDYPVTHQAQVLMDLLDKFGEANFNKWKPYPRPWDATNAAPAGVTRIGDAGGRSRREIVAHLNSLGHHLPMPDDDEGGDDDG